MLVLILLVVGGFRWRTDQTNRAIEESRKADYAQCVAINDNREANRTLATTQYGILSDRLRFDPPTNPKLTRAFRERLFQLQRLLRAQRALDCNSYVRPELPPDTGVH